MHATSSLVSLPAELVESIATHLDLSAFRSFRLVCSQLKQQSLHTFKERYFRKQTIAWDTDDFRKLLNIASHTVFADVVQDLVIDSTPRHARRLFEIERNISACSSQGNHDLEKILRIDYSQEKEQADELAKFWNETRQDQKTLASVFARIPGLRSITFSYSGMVVMNLVRVRKYCESSQNEMSRPFVSTMAAVAASGVAVQEIRLHEHQRYGAVSIGRLESLSPTLSRFDAAFDRLEVLDINLRDWRHPEEGFEPPLGRAPFVVRFLSKCVNLQFLSLSCFSSLEVDLFAEMAQNCRYTQLKICKLELFEISAVEDLFTFLNASDGALNELVLSHVFLHDESSSWADLMRRIASDLNLQHVELKGMFTRMGAQIGIARNPLGRVALTGLGLNTDLLEYADNLVSGHWGPACKQ